jgi:hypothetical protein
MGWFDWMFKKSAVPVDGKKPWKAGDRVLANWDGPYFYPGRIREVTAEACLVAFDDGDQAWLPHAVILVPDIQVGSQVFCRAKGGQVYLPGTVKQQKGETIQVRYDNGQDEWTSISMVRVQRAVPSLPSAPPAKQTIDLGGPLPDSDWRAGDRVLARWLDFFWYPGTLLGIGVKGFHVLFDDGDQRIVQEASIMPLVVEEGEQIFIRPKNQPQRIYTPATVTRVHGESIDVELEDGEHESNTRVSRARFWRSPVPFTNFAFEEGDRVLAQDCDDCVYPAEILSVQHDRVMVQFLDGPERMLTPELVRRFELRTGAKVECRWKGGPHYFPGVLSKVEGERAHVRYDDGDEEWTSIRLVRIPPTRKA